MSREGGEWTFRPEHQRRSPSGLFDDDFVAAARFHEPSASERGSRPKRARFSGWVTRSRISAVAALALIAGVIVLGLQSPYAHGPTLATYVVDIEGQPSPAALPLEFGHEVSVAVAWLESQTGRVLRVDPAATRSVDIDMSAADLLGDARDRTTSVLEGVWSSVAANPNAVPVVLVPAATTRVPGPGVPCAMGGPGGVVVFMENCAGRPSTTSTWPSPVSVTVAHEIVHALGGVDDCAPNYTYNGHVGDDPNDLMSTVGRGQGPITLDAGRDDYLGHGNPDCHDILNSPLWTD